MEESRGLCSSRCLYCLLVSRFYRSRWILSLPMEEEVEEEGFGEDGEDLMGGEGNGTEYQF
ncbi:hypothetical protein AALP_AA8G254800 [Arabis alpina]|uniref:Uncharacterized protein n=1 Tax=Arabis alpina TaxID=50452 RepID=A0A087G9D0_ARAAL|nr:hypothetical protein AALP_AA8G254800 [Arabis alpina]